MSAILAAFQFLTILPPLLRRPVTLPELGRAVGWFPLVGLALGAILAGLDWGVGQIFPAGVSAVLVMAVWLLASGAIHFDGFLDSCDGLFGGKTPEQRLEIMRDHRVGAFAVAGGGLILLLRFAALSALSDRSLALILAPTLGRWAMSLAIVGFPYAREQGLGRALKDHAGWPQAALATVTAISVALFAAQWVGLVAAGAALVTSLATLWLGARFIQSRIPGPKAWLTNSTVPPWLG